ncbi:MAG TPA: hypothetical protein VN429_05845 [Methanospirillum sp.]|nr:hypothetical protein [Methanospirillum sp.]
MQTLLGNRKGIWYQLIQANMPKQPELPTSGKCLITFGIPFPPGHLLPIVDVSYVYSIVFVLTDVVIT